ANYETQSNYRIQLSVTDVYGDTALKNIEVSVNNLAEDVSGSVVDGYVAGAIIFQDLDNDNVWDVGEAKTTTSSTGEFTLSNIIASSSAPLKIISGFDIATNKAIVTSLGTPSNISAQVLVSPLSTVASLANVNDTSANSATSINRVATYFDVSPTSQSNLDILSDDPLDKLRDSDTTIAAAAKDVFEANQFIMALTHSAEAIGDYLANAIDAAVHTELDSQSITGYEALASGGIDDYKKIAADALMESAASHIVPSQTLSSENAFQISDTQVILRDFDPATGLNIENRIPLISADSVLTLDTDNALLNLQNLNNLGADSGDFITPTLSFALAKIPTGSGSSSVAFDLIEGEDGSRDSGEKQFHMNFNVDWTSDGTTAQITAAAAQTVTGYYYTPGGTRFDFDVNNAHSDIISVTQSENGYPVMLNINLGGATHGYEFGLTSGWRGSAQEGAIHINLSTTLPIVDEMGATITSIDTVLRITNDTPLSVFVADADVHEGDATPTMVVYLNQAHSEDVVLSYTLSSIGADSATADVDYSATSGTVTILAGYTSATIALPILSDESLESSEDLTLTVNSVSAGTLINSTASITIH
ncbi:MAG: Calx-beta domain-containing protein, partial [Pseudomonadales bacterium]